MHLQVDREDLDVLSTGVMSIVPSDDREGKLPRKISGSSPRQPDEKPIVRLRRSGRQQRKSSRLGSTDTNPNESGISPDAYSSRTTPSSSSSSKFSLSLLSALGRSSTAADVAMFMREGGDDGDKPQDRERPIIPRMRTYTIPSMSVFHSPDAHKVQLKAAFHDIYYPKRLITSFCPTHFLLFNVQSTPDIRLAEHALYLAQLGTTSKDERVVKEALRVYQATIITLRRQISKPKAVLDYQVFVVANLLHLCKIYTEISSVEDVGQGRHHEGIGQLLVTKGPNKLKSLPLQISLQIYQQNELWQSLASRKKGRTCSPDWLQVLAEDKKCKWRLPQLTSFVLRLPAILECVDEILAQTRSDISDEETEIVDALSFLKTFESDLRKWMSEWYVENPEMPYWRVPVARCEWIGSLIDDEEGKAVFTHAFDFPGTAAAKAHQLFWMALLASMEASKDLSGLLSYPLPPSKSFEEQERRFRDEINESADSLCMCAVYMAQPDNGVDSWIEACQCLQFAEIWYEKSKQRSKVEWCGKAVQGIERRGIRAPRIGTRVYK